MSSHSKQILYLITKANWGGAQRYVYDTATAAKRAGHTVTVAYGGEGRLRARFAEENIRTIEIKSLGRDVQVGNDTAVFLELVRLMRHERPDIVHLNSAKAGGLGALAARIAGVPNIIFTAHGWAFNEGRPRWQRVVIRLFSGMTVLLSHTTICVSQAIRRDMAWLPFASKKLVVIHHGIDCVPMKSREEARKALLPRHEDDLWIGMLSELHPTKCVVNALFAMANLVKKHPNVILVVLGEGEERARLKKAIRTFDLTKHAFLPGFIPEGPSYLHAFDIFLHTSKSEALGYAILEAGCARLPVVATRVGGIPEIIEDGVNGLLVAPQRSNEITDALLSLLQTPSLQEQFGKALQETVATRFSKRRMLDATLALYHR